MPVTKFAIPEKYDYLEGCGAYHQSEALPGANPVAANSPQVPPYGLYTERLSGTSFTAPRAENLQTFMYRTSPTVDHGPFMPYTDDRLWSKPEGDQKLLITPNVMKWDAFPVGAKGDWVTSQRMIAKAGDPATKTGLAYHMYAAVEDMAPNSVFFSSDGDYLVIPQAGTLDVKTELGNLLIRQNEVAVIPRGVRYRVTLPHGPARGYICELFQSHFTLPELGPLGSCSLANARDFQIPVACFDGRVNESGNAETARGGQWSVITKMNSTLFVCTQDDTPFNVAAWHGTYYPFKYDLGRFSVIGSTLYDHPDPSIFTVLTAPSHGQPGHAVVDFVIFPPRYNVMEDTFWPPYNHRNIMAEFIGAIISDQSPDSQPTDIKFKPFAAKLTNTMVPHGMDKPVVEAARKKVLKPTKVDDDGLMVFLLESEMMVGASEYAVKAAQKTE
ncbi:homogentisate 1,2-dioxygenase [Beauveria bassiana ARSEF 2860]|uniref:homogentisate 1,2-dioxygenase n=1 Tax=Beauveria bassiana (strain ARSEF 2860) TaxID=655819 RepID=J5JCI4_BEAB2|nr:homogentisate 1,2-dioxygenase [Beauveria bassiana ARSEF 2860]EJP63728.1 homogentisate 1,2-dioxygenase [Beauveria bassiana ARSEF 2860]